MINSLLAIVAGENNNWYFDNNAESLVYALIGIIVVFAGMAVLIALLYLVGFIFKKTEGKKLTLFKRKQQAEEVLPQAEEEELSPEVKAAIVAAIMAFYAQEKPECEFTVKRIKRI